MFYNCSGKWRQCFVSKKRAVFRVDPVPATGKRGWKFRNYYKTACCMQERRLYGDPYHREYSRGKRYLSNLPDAWDDRPKSRSCGYKSWKRIKKKKQWMKKGDNIMSYPTFTPLGADSSAEIAGEGFGSEKKKFNYNVSETKVKSGDYTRPATNASQTDDDDLRIKAVEEEYEVPENRKNPERSFGRPGIRVDRDVFADTGLPPEGIKVLEEDTAVLNDDGKKHGPLNKWQYSGGLEGKTGPG